MSMDFQTPKKCVQIVKILVTTYMCSTVLFFGALTFFGKVEYKEPYYTKTEKLETLVFVSLIWPVVLLDTKITIAE